ncbi:MADS-box domain-containing protein NDAI_0E02700 [Naumovozyma dairenensis CBS 421]|uniref:MADS-box domain-containing protein n=1 Tax=Naumovozyma dairenensis (strain ATCC 10597 / BCRC 20456 / CBS 421 / NBRC 0211 / NRRL Y-12639) TaxID=1071378 RepID=G0WBG7_NAUDC|nr:hypothetical protein NDAI_0E02700 [Naumovozyma dairenensis CBS 421]CCD25087.1 hypothetical protein NDAI_0E02700 [Naumovozyma dairenensis CBS 421]
MGRRKIEIQPIHDERNRTVTFIKRKAGLFKKAHELAVLCQVDVAVIILGSNNTFYEFSSVDTNDLIKYYQHDKDLNHDVKDPSSYGAYTKKKKVTLNPKYHGRSKKARVGKHDQKKDEEIELGADFEGNDGEDEDEEGQEFSRDDIEDSNTTSSNNMIPQSSTSVVSDDDRTANTLRNITIHSTSNKRSRSENNIGPTFIYERTKKPDLNNNKRLKKESSVLNPLQQHVQKQFQNLYHMTSNSPTELPKLSKYQETAPMVPSPTASSSSPNNSTNNHNVSLKPSFAKTENDSKGSPLNRLNMQFSPPIGNSGKEPFSSLDKDKNSLRIGSRPVLRVQIPTNNNTYNTSVYSEPSSATSITRSMNNNGSPSRIDTNFQNDSLNRNDGSKISKTPTNTSYSFTAGLPPIFSATSALPQYVATPLQSAAAANSVHPNGNTTNIQNNSHGNDFIQNSSSYFLQRQSQNSQQQQQHQQRQQSQPQQHQQQPQQPQNIPKRLQLKSGQTGLYDRLFSPILAEDPSGPRTGSLPSKFVHDLIIPSPSANMPMFQDWSLGPESAKLGANNSSLRGSFNNSRIGPNNNKENITNNNSNNNNVNNTTTNNSTNINASTQYSFSGSTGLTPYITSQTPLSNRFFNFSTEVDDDKKKMNKTDTVADLNIDGKKN